MTVTQVDGEGYMPFAILVLCQVWVFLRTGKRKFSKNFTFSKTKKKWEKWHYFAFLKISLMSYIIKDSYIVISAPVSNWLPYVVWLEHVKRVTTHIDMYMEKRGVIFITFSDSCGYSCLILQYMSCSSKNFGR